MNFDLKNQFVEELDNIYKTNIIYRTIVVCNDELAEYKRLLENKDFSVYVVDTITTINYDTLDHRIILIKHSLFEEFLNNIISNNNTDFYTYIAFTYDNDNLKKAIYKKYNNYSDIISNII